MKRVFTHFIAALLTFVVGVSIGNFIGLAPSSQGGTSSFQQPNARLSEAASAWRVLLSFENQDLRKLNDKSKVDLQCAIDSLIGKKSEFFFAQFMIPRLISKISNSHGELRYALIEEYPLVTIPGECGMRVSLFTLEGKHNGTSEFASGWRISLKEMRLKQLRNVRGDVLEVESGPTINGRDVGRQYYALIGEKFILIRLEDGDGKLIRNLYGAPNHTIGLKQTGRTAADWQKDLESNNSAEVLGTLMWLGGVHLDPNSAQPEYEHEEKSEARLVEDVRALETVQATIKRLSQSKDPWIREAAKLASVVQYYR